MVQREIGIWNDVGEREEVEEAIEGSYAVYVWGCRVEFVVYWLGHPVWIQSFNVSEKCNRKSLMHT